MKNRIKYPFGSAVLASLSAAALLLAACSEEEFTRDIGTMPDDDAMTGISAELYRPAAVNGIIRLIEEDAADRLRIRLSQPAPAAVNVTVAIDAELCEAYNKEHGTDFALFPVEKVSFGATNGAVTIEAGKKESADLTITFRREGVEKGRYLLPVRATAAGETVTAPEQQQIHYYRLVVAEPAEVLELAEYPFKMIGYVNTDEMSPLLGNGIRCDVVDMIEFTMVEQTSFDIEILRKASIGMDKVLQRPVLRLNPDLHYVLENRDQYIVPVQKNGHLVLLCVTGGGDGLGFRNLTDAYIADFVYQLEKVVTGYQLDGVNFFDIETAYGKEDMPAIDPASYAKLIKATKEALGADKLVTLACDAASTDELSTAQEGIEAGAYLDMAWSGVFDEVVDAYAEGAKLKPVAGLAQSQYGGVMLKTHNTAKRGELSEILIPQITALYRESECGKLFAFWDMPTTSSGYEQGALDTFNMVTNALEDWDMIYGDLYFYTFKWWIPDGDIHNYGVYKKDW